MNVTLPITDPNIIAALPDTSVYDLFFAENNTDKTIKSLFDKKNIRRKLQFLFSYKAPSDVKQKLITKLINAFMDGTIKDDTSKDDENKDAKIEKISPTVLKKGNIIYDFDIFSVGNAFFTDDSLNKLLFTEDMIKNIFSYNDTDFENAIFSVPEFWNKLLSNESLTNSFKTNFPDKYKRAEKVSEVAFVKILAKESEMDPVNYNSVIECASDPMFVEIVESGDSAHMIYTSVNGFKLDVLNYFNITDDSAHGILHALNSALKDVDVKHFVNAYGISYLEDSIKENQAGLNSDDKDKANKLIYKIINNDIYFGKIFTRTSNIDGDYTFTQLLNTPDYNGIVFKSALETEFNYILKNTQLLNNKDLHKKYSDLIFSKSKLKNLPICSNNDDNSHVYVSLINGNTIEYYDVVFPDATSSQFKVNPQSINVGTNVLSVTDVDGSKSVAYIDTALNLESNSANFATFTSPTEGKKIVGAFASDDMLVYIDKDGNIQNTKYAGIDKINIATCKGLSITKDNYAVIDDKEVVVRGVFEGRNTLGLKETLIKNFTDLAGVFTVDKDLLALLNSGVLKKVTENGLVDYTGLSDYVVVDKDGKTTGSALTNGVTNIVSVLDTNFVQDKTGLLWYKDTDKKVTTIANVKEIYPVNRGLYVVDTNNNPYLLVNFNNRIRKYDFLFNV